MAEYRAVVVDEARIISSRYDKDIVVIVSWNRAHNRLHTTTYGRTAFDKQHAAALGEILCTAAGGDMAAAVSFEDFRANTQAQWAEERDRLLAEIRALEKKAGIS